MTTLSSLTGPTAELVEVGAENLNIVAVVVCTHESELSRLGNNMDQLLLRLCGRESTDCTYALALGTVRGSHAPTTRSDMSRGAFQTLTLVVRCFLALMVVVICKSRQFYFQFLFIYKGSAVVFRVDTITEISQSVEEKPIIVKETRRV